MWCGRSVEWVECDSLTLGGESVREMGVAQLHSCP